ncbi:MAG: adenylate/guanylate cyclase domain-containing protein [Leptospira sp.]|nr:adenylate/guanylate cyclase domain-containing protein [Leptospira sp.]
MFPKKKSLFFSFFATYLVVPFLSSFFALLFADYTAPQFMPSKFLLLFEATRSTKDLLLQFYSWSPFPILTGILTYYCFPIYKSLCNSCMTEKEIELAKKRVTHSPITISFIGLCGWEISTILSVNRVSELFPEAPTSSLIVVWFIFAMWGIFVFAFCYSLIDYLNKVFILPVLFPQGGLGVYVKGIRFSIITKQVIFWIAGTLFPILLLVLGILFRSGKDLFDLFHLLQTDILFQLVVVVILISFLLAFSFAESIQYPLNDIEVATDKIKEEKFDTRVYIYSSDELGLLGDSVNEMAEGLSERERIKDTFGRIVDPRVRDYLLSNKQSLGGKVTNATILFSDLRDFTKLSEKRKPEEVLYILNRYFQEMSNAVEKHGGFINKFIGDAILAVFGTPLPLKNHAEEALFTALEMQKNLDALNQRFLAEGLPALEMGIGIHSGNLLVGNIGSENRMEFTVIGDTVNTASRVEGLCKGLGEKLLLSEQSLISLPDHLQSDFVLKGEFELKGRETKEKIFAKK